MTLFLLRRIGWTGHWGNSPDPTRCSNAHVALSSTDSVLSGALSAIGYALPGPSAFRRSTRPGGGRGARPTLHRPWSPSGESFPHMEVTHDRAGSARAGSLLRQRPPEIFVEACEPLAAGLGQIDPKPD